MSEQDLLRILDHVRNQRNLAEEYKKALEIAREALEFYADPNNYDEGIVGTVVGTPSGDVFEADNGNDARRALRQIEEVME